MLLQEQFFVVNWKAEHERDPTALPQTKNYMYSSDSYSGLHSTLFSQEEMKYYKTGAIPFPFSQMQRQPVAEGDGEPSTQYRHDRFKD